MSATLGSQLSLGAALALNFTANLLASYAFGNQYSRFQASQKCLVGSHLPSQTQELMFGNMTGLLEQPNVPMGRIIVFGARGGDDKGPSSEHRGDTIPICNSIIRLGWSCVPVFYSDSVHDEILDFSLDIDGYISRVNPDEYEDFSTAHYEKLLETLANQGVVAMSHPTLMQRFGSKDALVKVQNLRTGLSDTFAYYDEDEFRERFSATLAVGPRVIKQNRGSQGEGIWICKLEDESMYRQHTSLPMDTPVVLTEAFDNHVEKKTLGEFLDFASQYVHPVNGKRGEIIDQAFMPRIIEGEVRVLFVGDKPIEIVHKKPKEGGVSATLKSGAVYTTYKPDDPAFERLMSSFVKRDLPKLLPALGLGEFDLPLLWTADFILGGPRPPWASGKDYYFIGELNCSCVGITTQLHVADLVAQEAIRLCMLHKERRDANATASH